MHTHYRTSTCLKDLGWDDAQWNFRGDKWQCDPNFMGHWWSPTLASLWLPGVRSSFIYQPRLLFYQYYILLYASVNLKKPWIFNWKLQLAKNPLVRKKKWHFRFSFGHRMDRRFTCWHRQEIILVKKKELKVQAGKSISSRLFCERYIQS